jgi:hypothetical protein
MIEAIRLFIRRSPFLYLGVLGWRQNVSRLRATKDSELVVEAFPRSGNTTSMYALFYAQGESFKVGHHLHVPAHVKYAVFNQIPCLIIMRKPLDCVASRMVMKKGGDPRRILSDYIDFSKTVLALKNKLVVVCFEDVIRSGLGAAVVAVNEKFGTEFKQPDGSVEEQAWVEAQVRKWNLEKSDGDVERLSIPSEAKRGKATEMKERICAEASDKLAIANELYEALTPEGLTNA